jgi:hypothetical protein
MRFASRVLGADWEALFPFLTNVEKSEKTLSACGHHSQTFQFNGGRKFRLTYPKHQTLLFSPSKCCSHSSNHPSFIPVLRWRRANCGRPIQGGWLLHPNMSELLLCLNLPRRRSPWDQEVR